MRIGVTGILASGKGTVCSMFRELGAVEIDTDIIAREIVQPGAEGLMAIINAFGSGFIDESGSLKRREFADYIFKDETRVKKLNSITHPLILRTALDRSAGPGIFVINTPLLFETGFNRDMDRNIVVTAENLQALERGAARDGISTEEIKERLNHQIPLNEKVKSADYIIDNSGTLENTKRQVIELWKILTETRET
jgi:dephospho-CoA kinase